MMLYQETSKKLATYYNIPCIALQRRDIHHLEGFLGAAMTVWLHLMDHPCGHVLKPLLFCP